jgi:ABC-type nitrate/sulfonate/bicarbonate transport system ATPase subunit
MTAIAPREATSAGASAPAVELRAVSHTFEGRQAVETLREVSFSVAGGAFVSLVGPSGCGKSTLLRVLAGLLVPSDGDARVAGASVLGQPGRVGYMPQRDLLLPWRRVRDNATLGAEMSGVRRSEARAAAGTLYERFGLSGFERAWPSQLSGGMRQRLALLRTFLVPRQTLLLDEPFGALDAITRREMHAWLQDVWLADGRTVLLVTHDIDEALSLSDVVYVMSPRPGRIARCIEVPLPRPRTTHDLTSPAFASLKSDVLGALEQPAPLLRREST